MDEREQGAKSREGNIDKWAIIIHTWVSVQ